MIHLFPKTTAVNRAADKSRIKLSGTGKPNFNDTPPAVMLKKTLMRDTVQFGAGPDSVQNKNFQRWRDILTKKVREDLQQFRSPSQYKQSEDGQNVMALDDYIDLPKFMRGSNEGGQGQGQGQPGDEVGEVGENGQPQPGKGQKGEGAGKPQKGKGEVGEAEGEEGEEGEGDKAGEGAGDMKPDDWLPHISRYEIAKWFDKDLELPNFQPRGQNNIQKIEEVWDTISRQGTPGNLSRRHSFLQAMRREMAMQGKDFTASNIQWRKDDFRFFNTTDKPIPKENAVCIYILDTSGSMTPQRKKMARDTQFYFSTVIQAKYGEINAGLRNEVPSADDFGNGVAEEFIIHDDSAEITTEEKFFTTTKSGGTKFVPALKEVERLVLGTESEPPKYPLDQWNVYVFHYTDGDTFNDDKEASGMIKNLIDKGMNLYGYLQTEGAPTSTFNKRLEDDFKGSPFVRKATLKNDSPEECKRGVYSMLGTDSVRQEVATQAQQKQDFGDPSMGDPPPRVLSQEQIDAQEAWIDMLNSSTDGSA